MNCLQLVPTFLLRLGILIGDVIYEIMSEDTTLKTVKINCGSPEEHVNGTDVEFQKHLLRLLSRHESLYYDDVDNLVHYKSSKNIVVVNETEKINLGTWSTEKGFSLTQGQPMSRDRRFFRIGIVPEVSSYPSLFSTVSLLYPVTLFLVFRPCLGPTKRKIRKRELSSGRATASTWPTNWLKWWSSILNFEFPSTEPTGKNYQTANGTVS